jgi:hypothetical protein
MPAKDIYHDAGYRELIQQVLTEYDNFASVGISGYCGE